MTTDGLDDSYLALLDFERLEWTYPGAKEQAVRERFDIGMATYYARLNWLIDQPAALAHAPQLVRRLQRLREQRKRRRTASIPRGTC